MPVIGFAAAPWTLACYMIEGRTRGDISRAKQMLREQPDVVRELLDRIARATAEYLKSQIAAGASIVQLFDTWAGELTEANINAFELPATQMIFEALGDHDVTKILFAKGSAQHLESLAKSGADVLSVDWKTDLAEARSKLGRRWRFKETSTHRSCLVLKRRSQARRVEAVEKTGGVGHILNLGHGILPTLPLRTLRRLSRRGRPRSWRPGAEIAETH